MEIDMRQVLDYSSLLIIVRILLLFFIYRTVFFRTLAFLLKDNVLYLRMHLLHYMRLVQALLFLNYQKITELEKSNRSLRVKNCSSSSFMFGNMVFTSWRQSFWVLISASTRIIILIFDRHCLINSLGPHSHCISIAQI